MPLKILDHQWPGGIPPSIRARVEPLPDEEDCNTVTKAWRRFVRENWVHRNGEQQRDSGDEDAQRRALIEKWAAAEQDFRDSYENKAPDSEAPFDWQNPESFIRHHANPFLNRCLIITSSWRPSAEKKALLTKFLISLFDWEEGTEYPMHLSYIGGGSGVDLLASSPEKLKFIASVEVPNFLDIHMTVDGSVVFYYPGPYLLIDDQALETGLGLWVDYHNNGTIRYAYRCQVASQEFPHLWRSVHVLRQTLDTALEYMGEQEEHEDPSIVLSDPPADMKRPIAELYSENSNGNL